MRPTVSCLIPAYNAERYLSATIESALAQTVPFDEVIVADNGSTDRTAEVARSFAEPVRVVPAEPARDQRAAQNVGLESAGGELVCFLDSDDLYLPVKTERQLERFEAEPGLAVCYAIAECLWEPGLEAEEERFRRHGRTRATRVLQTAMIRRELIGEVGGFTQATAGGAIPMLARITEAGCREDVVEEVLVRRRMHAESDSHKDSSLDAILDLLKGRIDSRRGSAADDVRP